MSAGFLAVHAAATPFMSALSVDGTRRLVATHWIRVAAWSLRSVLALGWISR